MIRAISSRINTQEITYFDWAGMVDCWSYNIVALVMGSGHACLVVLHSSAADHFANTVYAIEN